MAVSGHDQVRAVLRMRWRMLANGLRTRSGKFELTTRVFWSAFFVLLWLGVAAGLGVAANGYVHAGRSRELALLLWPVFAMWQLLPIMLASYRENIDLTVLLRFPVSFRRYFLLYAAAGLVELPAALGGLALGGLYVGMVTARASLWAPALAALALFALCNLLLTRAIFAWLDRMLAQRRTRELLGMLFLFAFLALQWLNPAYHGGHNVFTATPVGRAVRHLAAGWHGPLPPSLAGSALADAAAGSIMGFLAGMGGLLLFAGVAAGLLAARLRREYAGESLTEAVATSHSQPSAGEKLRGGRGSASPMSAIFVKEFHYLTRSGAMLYSLIAPLFLLFLIGQKDAPGYAFVSRFALPMGAAYGFLGLTRLMSNSLGGEANGLQLYWLAPVRMRTVILAKNIFQTALFASELILVVVVVHFRFGPQSVLMIVVTAAYLLFALPMQLAMGNLLSLRMAYRMTLTRMSREPGATANASLSLLLQLVILGIGAAVFLPLQAHHRAKLAILIFLVLAALAFAAWMLVLNAADGIAYRRREALSATLVRGR